jgi:hypothetical protein
MRVIPEAIFSVTPADIEVFTRVRRDDADLFQIQQRFLALYGDTYAHMRPRFTQHDTDGSFTSDIAFMQQLGPDVAHETHPLTQLDIVRRYHLPAELGLTAIMHDWGEIHPQVGDIRYGTEKSSDEQSQELDMLTECARNMFGEEGEKIAEAVKEHLDTQTELGALFKISERIGYMHTIIRAGELALFAETHPALRTHSPEQIRVLWSIASDARYHIEPLLDAKSEVPLVHALFQKNARILEIIEERRAQAA